ncbi:MAG: hypothetical protein IT419_17620 [Planctomycetes bacterium]|nr:hypothetical protein [Planctomycetota bacterium]
MKETDELLGQLQSRAAAVEARLKALLTNNEGKRIGQDPVAFLAYLKVRDEPGVSVEEVKVRRKNVGSIQSGLQAELKRLNVGWVPGPKLKLEMGDIGFWARDRISRIEQKESWLASALSRSPTDLDFAQVKTLEEVIREYEARQMESWGKARLQGEESAQKEAQDRIRESARIAELEKATQEAERHLKEERAKNAAIQVEYDLKIEQMKAETYKLQEETQRKLRDLTAEVNRLNEIADAKRFAADTEAKVVASKTISEAEKKLLAQKCHDPEVRRLLAPFLAAGYTQPKSADQLPDKLPISFSQLSSSGALSPDREGMRRLIIVATWKGDKVRPRWSVPQNFNWLSPDQIEMVKKAQGLLIELGPVMVEQKLLSP